MGAQSFATTLIQLLIHTQTDNTECWSYGGVLICSDYMKNLESLITEIHISSGSPAQLH